jgi:hypothetical protein
MTIKEFSEELKRKIDAEIEEISIDQGDPLEKTSKIIATLGKILNDLKEFVVTYKFRNVQEEIIFFKSVKPKFASQLIFYKELLDVQFFESYNNSAQKLKYFQRYLKRIERHAITHKELYLYIMTGSSCLDEMYFTLATKQTNPIIDNRFSTSKEIQCSQIMAYEKLKEYLLKAVQKIESPSMVTNSTLTWTGSKTDLIELIYALHGAGVFNSKDADLKLIASHFENVFDVKLGNYYRIFQDIQLRKSGQTNFLDLLKGSFLARIGNVK